jgi:hypothetical protein
MLAHVLEGLSADAWRRRNGCGAVVISLAQTGVSILYIADPKIGQAASEEAARQEDVMAALAEKALHVLWQLRCHLTILVASTASCQRLARAAFLPGITLTCLQHRRNFLSSPSSSSPV